MIITKEWLEKRNCRGDFEDWFLAQEETDGEKLVKKLVEKEQLSWANWLLVRLLTYPQKVEHGVYAAELVLDIFEEKYPLDKRPRQAIEDAKNWLKNPSRGNRNAARAVARNAERNAQDAQDAGDSMLLKIINYGLTLLTGRKTHKGKGGEVNGR